MADLTAAAPVESAKSGDYLHSRERIPARPAATRGDLVRRFLPLALGIACAAGFVALGFQTRATWSTHRDWVIPVTAPLLAIGGVALGYLLARGRANALATGALFLALTVLLTVLNIWRGAHTDGSDGLRDALSILAGLALGGTVAAFVIAAIAVELRDPARAPAPEM